MAWGHPSNLRQPGTEPFFALNPGVGLRELAAPADQRGAAGKLGTNIARVSRLRVGVARPPSRRGRRLHD